MGKNRTGCPAQKRPTQDRAGERTSLQNYDELEMDSAPPRNGIMDARLQSSAGIKDLLVSKVRTGLAPIFRTVNEGPIPVVLFI